MATREQFGCAAYPLVRKRRAIAFVFCPSAALDEAPQVDACHALQWAP